MDVPSPQLTDSLSRLQPGDHVCFIYESDDANLVVLASYLFSGVQSGQKVILLTSAASIDDALQGIRQAGFDLSLYRGQGQFVVVDYDHPVWRARLASLDEMPAWLQAETEQALAAGYKGLRIACDMTTLLASPVRSPDIIAFKSNLNRYFEKRSCTLLCLYDRRRVSSHLLLTLLQVHPSIIIGDELYENFYYLPPQNNLSVDPIDALFENSLKNIQNHNRRFGAFFETSLGGSSLLAVQLDARFNFIHVNQAYANLKRREASFFVVRNYFDLFPDPHWEDIFNRVLQTGQPYHAYSLPGQEKAISGNAPKYWDWNVAPVKNRWGQVIGLVLTIQDVTERVQAERAGLSIRARLKAMFLSSIMAICLTDKNGSVLESNPIMERLLGYTSDELRRLTYREFTHPEDWETVARSLLNLSESSNPAASFEVRLTRKDGATTWVEATISTISEPDGQTGALLWTGTDINQRKQAEKDLRASKDHLARAQALAHLGNYSWDIARSALSCSEEVLRIWDSEDQEFSYEVMLSRIHPLDRARVMEANQQTRFSGIPFSMDYRIVWRDGSMRWLHDHAYFERDQNGRPTHLFGIVQDITDRKLMEDALRESEARYRTLLDASPNAVVVLQDERIAYVNLAGTRMIGYENPAELFDSLVEDFIHPESLGRANQYLTRLAHGLSNPVAEMKLVRKDGSVLIVEATSAALIFRGRPAAIIQAYDITERKFAEMKMADLLEHTSRQTLELQAILQLSSTLRKVQTYDEVISTLVELSQISLDAEAGALILIEENSFHLPAAAGLWQGFAGSRQVSEHKGLLKIIRSGKPVFYRSPLETGHLTDQPLLNEIFASVSALALIPLKVGELPIGVILLGAHNLPEFDSEKAGLAATIAEIASNTLHRMRLMDRLEHMVASRTQELATVYDIISTASSSFEIEQAMDRALSRVLKSMGCRWGAVYLKDEADEKMSLLVEQGLPDETKAYLANVATAETSEGWILASGEPLLIPDLALVPGLPLPEKANDEVHAYLGVPMRVHTQVVGVLFVVRVGNSFSLDEISLLSSVADHLAIVVENSRLHTRSEQAAVLEERSRLARDLHDSATQSLYSLGLYADASLALAESGNIDQLKNYLQRLAEIAHQALRELRLLVFQLRPSVLEHEGLAAALQYRLNLVENKLGIKASLQVDPEASFEPRVEETLYWIALEALNNVLKHAHAECVSIQVKRENGHAWVRIEDDGKGFDPHAPPGAGMGLSSMRQRAEHLHGQFSLTSLPSEGTVVEVCIPIRDGDENG